MRRIKTQFAPLVQWRARIRFDAGRVTIRTTATNKRAAIAGIMQAEKCPRGAVETIRKA